MAFHACQVSSNEKNWRNHQSTVQQAYCTYCIYYKQHEKGWIHWETKIKFRFYPVWILLLLLFVILINRRIQVTTINTNIYVWMREQLPSRRPPNTNTHVKLSFSCICSRWTMNSCCLWGGKFWTASILIKSISPSG